MKTDLEIQLQQIAQSLPRLRRTIYFSEIGSTNAEAAAAGRDEAPDGTLILADSQSAGRGRLDRRWESPAGKGLYFSLVLRPHLAAGRAAFTTLAVGLGLGEALRQAGLRELQIKWPNDLMLAKKKLGGILTELFHCGDWVDFLVVGVGINVSQQSDDFSPEVAPLATSLKIATGKDWDRGRLLGSLLPAIFAEVDRLVQAGPAPLISRWEKSSGMLGQRISFQEDGREGRGTVLGLGADGRLRVQTEDGGIVELLAGDTKLL